LVSLVEKVPVNDGPKNRSLQMMKGPNTSAPIELRNLLNDVFFLDECQLGKYR
jgi:hypothetical protein